MEKISKYPRTQHLQGSRLQKGDEDLSQVRFDEVKGLYLIIEEKLDGANAGISFDENGNLLLQSRGHYLTGGPRERHWDLFKQWAHNHTSPLFDALEDRYIMYGEWMYAKHTVFYDMLPAYFMEFDILDKRTGEFLSTQARRSVLYGRPFVKSVRVLHEGPIGSLDDVTRLVTHSYCKTGNWRQNLERSALRAGVDPELALTQTDKSDKMEGLYIKVEENPVGKRGSVIQRLKWVRDSFSNAIADSETHWLDRPIIPNTLAAGVDIFSPYG